MKYMDSLPEEKRPLVGTEGAKYRRKQMMNQLPIHDHDAEYCDNLTEEEKEKMNDFCKMRNEQALGVGDIREKTQPATKWVGTHFIDLVNRFPTSHVLFMYRLGKGYFFLLYFVWCSCF